MPAIIVLTVVFEVFNGGVGTEVIAGTREGETLRMAKDVMGWLRS